MVFARFNLAFPYMQAVKFKKQQKSSTRFCCHLYTIACIYGGYKLHFYTLQYIKMRKTTVINGDYFTFKKFTPVFNGNNDIYDIYSKPSCYKIQAFNEWNEKLVEIYGMSGNSCTFSIHGYIKDEN